MPEHDLRRAFLGYPGSIRFPILPCDVISTGITKLKNLNDEILDRILPDAHRASLTLRMDRLMRRNEFLDFVQLHEGTIGKEIRNQKTLEDCLDVVAELELACLLAPHVTKIEYQVKLPRSSKRLDFLFQFPCGFRVGAEVKRIRETEAVRKLDQTKPYEIPYTQRESFKFTDRILESLRQLHSDCANIVFIKISSTTHELYDAYEAWRHIVARFERGDSDFFTTKGFESMDDFLHQYCKMSALVVRPLFTPIWGHEPKGYTRNRYYQNPDAAQVVPKHIEDLLSNADIVM